MGVAFSSKLSAQDNSLSSKIIENTTFTADLGLLHFWGDVQTYPYYHVVRNKNENQFGAGISLDYWFNNTLSIGGHYARGRLVGTKRTFGLAQYNFTRHGVFFETLLSETSLRVGLNVFNLINNNPERRFNLMLNAGQGLCFYESTLRELNEQPYVIDELKGTSGGPQTEPVTSFGGALVFKINHKYDIGLGTSGRFVWSDNLDAWIGEGSANDMYSFTSLSLTYHLNPKKPKQIIIANNDKEKINPIEEPDTASTIVKEDPPKVDPKDTLAGVDDRGTVKPDTPAVAVEEPETTEGEGETGTETETGGTETGTTTEGESETDTGSETETTSTTTETGTSTTTQTSTEGSGGLGAGSTTETNEGIPWSEENGYFVIVGCFKSKENAVREAVRWKTEEKAIMNLNSKSGTWYMVAVQRYDTKKEALQHMNKLRNSGRSPGAWVHVKL